MSNISKIKLSAEADALDIKDAFARSVQYGATLTSSAWSLSGSEYLYNLSLSSLTCGSDGTISPDICWTSNVDEYNNITEAIATPGEGIVFAAEAQPSADIGIIIRDIH